MSTEREVNERYKTNLIQLSLWVQGLEEGALIF